MLDLCSKVEALVVLRDLKNAPSTVNLSPALPDNHLAKLCSRQLYDIFREQKWQVDYTFSKSYRSELEDCINRLKMEIGSIPTAGSTERAVFDSFNDLRERFNGRFDSLVQLWGGITTVFPGTSTFEVSFSILGQEETNQRYNVQCC